MDQRNKQTLLHCMTTSLFNSQTSVNNCLKWLVTESDVGNGYSTYYSAFDWCPIDHEQSAHDLQDHQLPGCTVNCGVVLGQVEMLATVLLLASMAVCSSPLATLKALCWYHVISCGWTTPTPT